MDSNHVICKNEVIIEGTNVGQFESFSYQANSRTLGNTAVLTLPLYAIGVGATNGRATSRVRAEFKAGDLPLIKPCAQVEVWCWYDTWSIDKQATVSMEKVKVFQGFISHVVDGFPTKLHLVDNAFILRFGEVQKVWDKDATLQSMVEDVIPIAQKAFDEERKKLKFTRAIPKLTYSTEKHNVQAITTSLSFREWSGRSPFDCIQKLMQLLVLYGGVSDDYNVFVGAGVEKNTRPLIGLSTAENVLERDVTPIDGRFVDYDVKVTGILASGKQYTATGGYKTSNDAQKKSAFEATNLETYRAHSTLTTVDGIQEFADRLLAMLKGERNKGTITLLLYPKCKIMDWLDYKDTVFPNLGGGYYVLDYEFNAGSRGYFQKLTVTDKVFAI